MASFRSPDSDVLRDSRRCLRRVADNGKDRRVHPADPLVAMVVAGDLEPDDGVVDRRSFLRPFDR